MAAILFQPQCVNLLMLGQEYSRTKVNAMPADALAFDNLVFFAHEIQ